MFELSKSELDDLRCQFGTSKWGGTRQIGIPGPQNEFFRRHLENHSPPVGLMLCAQKDEAVARYALEGLPNKVIDSEYRIHSY